ncbi:hypothetical protein DAI22_05g085100 [Oryza sativa Japonica Group]|nr:hypothetical protein DAI22_05g085100 [Oryza sativa Japonica Group]
MLPAALLPHLLIPPMMGRIASPLIPPKPGRITWPRSGRTPGTPMTSSPPMLWSTRCWSNASALLWSPPPRIRSPSPSLSRSWTYNEPLLAAILVSTAKSCSGPWTVGVPNSCCASGQGQANLCTTCGKQRHVRCA